MGNLCFFVFGHGIVQDSSLGQGSFMEHSSFSAREWCRYTVWLSVLQFSLLWLIPCLAWACHAPWQSESTRADVQFVHLCKFCHILRSGLASSQQSQFCFVMAPSQVFGKAFQAFNLQHYLRGWLGAILKIARLSGRCMQKQRMGDAGGGFVHSETCS